MENSEIQQRMRDFETAAEQIVEYQPVVSNHRRELRKAEIFIESYCSHGLSPTLKINDHEWWPTFFMKKVSVPRESIMAVLRKKHFKDIEIDIFANVGTMKRSVDRLRLRKNGAPVDHLTSSSYSFDHGDEEGEEFPENEASNPEKYRDIGVAIYEYRYHTFKGREAQLKLSAARRRLKWAETDLLKEFDIREIKKYGEEDFVIEMIEHPMTFRKEDVYSYAKNNGIQERKIDFFWALKCRMRTVKKLHGVMVSVNKKVRLDGYLGGYDKDSENYEIIHE